MEPKTEVSSEVVCNFIRELGFEPKHTYSLKSRPGLIKVVLYSTDSNGNFVIDEQKGSYCKVTHEIAIRYETATS